MKNCYIVFVKNFRAWLDVELKRRGLTQAELAERGGFNDASLSRVLSGQRQMGVDMARQIGDVLHVHPAVVMIKAGVFPESELFNASRSELIEIVNGLSQRDYLAAVTMLRALAEQRGKTTSGE